MNPGKILIFYVRLGVLAERYTPLEYADRWRNYGERRGLDI